MKKGLLTIIVSLFILIPISVNAGQLSCDYKLKSIQDDDYGTLNITKKDSGEMYINGNRIGNGDIELGKIDGKSVTLYYSSTPNVNNELLDYVTAADSASYCLQLEECKNDRLPSESRGTTFDCKEKMVNDESWFKFIAKMLFTFWAKTEKKCVATNVKVNNQDAYLNSVFNSSTCPSINFTIAYDKNNPGTKKYLVFLNPKEANGTVLSDSLFGAGAIKQDGVLTNLGTGINNDIEDVPFCAETSGFLKVFKIIGYAIFVIKILIPIALIIFGSLDFFKAMISSNDDNIKKATSTIIQRAIIAVAIFFVPTLIYYFAGLIGNAVDRNNSYFKNCTTCLLKPDECVARNPEKITNQEMGNDINENNN